jgi:hypothetical protein
MNDDDAMHAAFAAQADGYARALELAEGLAASCGEDAAPDDRLAGLLRLLDEAVAREAALAPVKQRWQQTGCAPDAPLRAVMDRIDSLIERLSRHLQTIEHAARQRRDRLADELDACNRRRQMRRAYLGKS